MITFDSGATSKFLRSIFDQPSIRSTERTSLVIPGIPKIESEQKGEMS